MDLLIIVLKDASHQSASALEQVQLLHVVPIHDVSFLSIESGVALRDYLVRLLRMVRISYVPDRVGHPASRPVDAHLLC